ncbi:hypothetical protein BOX15_Mlig006224g1, partial [Macrostomum lignano]
SAALSSSGELRHWRELTALEKEALRLIHSLLQYQLRLEVYAGRLPDSCLQSVDAGIALRLGLLRIPSAGQARAWRTLETTLCRRAKLLASMRTPANAAAVSESLFNTSKSLLGSARDGCPGSGGRRLTESALERLEAVAEAACSSDAADSTAAFDDVLSAGRAFVQMLVRLADLDKRQAGGCGTRSDPDEKLDRLCAAYAAFIGRRSLHRTVALLCLECPELLADLCDSGASSLGDEGAHAQTDAAGGSSSVYTWMYGSLAAGSLAAGLYAMRKLVAK